MIDKEWISKHFHLPHSSNILSQLEIQTVDTDKICKYGIDYLDDQLSGIHNHELILLGAKSGAGKTTMVEHIIMHNLEANKKIAFFRLEGDNREFWKRQQHRHLVNQIKAAGIDYNLTYSGFVLNKIPNNMLKMWNKSVEHINNVCENLFIYNNEFPLNNFYLKDLMKWTADSGLDMIVIDHINYFDWCKGTKEWEEEKKAMKTLKESAERNGVPILIVSHVRKGNAQNYKIIPDEDDYHGSSDKNKIAVTSIMLGSYSAQYDELNKIYPTLIRIVKSRHGASTNLMGLKLFNGENHEYMKGYKTYNVFKFNDKSSEDSGLINDKLGFTWRGDSWIKIVGEKREEKAHWYQK